MPFKFLTNYPKFLRPSKHYPHRRLNDKHVESVMKSALHRFEKDLKDKEKEKYEDACRYTQ
jgi:ribosomal protein S20